MPAVLLLEEGMSDQYVNTFKHLKLLVPVKMLSYNHWIVSSSTC